MILVSADLGRFRAFRVVSPEAIGRAGNNQIHELETPGLEQTPESIGSLTSDQSGRFPADGNPGMSNGEATGIALEEERRSIGHLAKKIDQLILAEKPQSWKLAAPKKINARLVDQLSPEARERLVDNLHLDLSKMPANEIGKRFGERP